MAKPQDTLTPSKQGQAAKVRPQELRQWISQVPYGNPELALELVLAELHRISAVELKAGRQMELLDLIAGAYVRLFDFIFPPSSHALRNTSFDARRHHRLAKAGAITGLLADGYEQVLSEVSKAKTLFFSASKPRAHALQRAMLFLGLTQMHLYAAYRTPAPALKARMFRLHRRTLTEKFSAPGKSDSDTHPEFDESPTHLYVRTVLTSAVDPHRVRPNEVWRLFQLLGPFVDGVKIVEKQPAGDPAGLLVVDSKGLRRVVPVGYVSVGNLPAAPQFLDTRMILGDVVHKLKALRAREVSLAGPFHTESRDVILLAQVLDALRGDLEREMRREPVAELVRAAFGVAACHFALGGQSIDEAKATFDGAAHDRLSEEERDDTLKVIDPHSGKTVDSRLERRKKAGDDDAANKAGEDPDAYESIVQRIDNWQTVDIAPGGIGVQSNDDSKLMVLGVGELVGLHLGTRKAAVGVVRWLSINESGAYTAGVEYLPGEPEAVTVRGIDAKQAPGPRRPAIALAPASRSDAPTVVTYASSHRASQEFLMEATETGQAYRIRTTAMHNSTHFFERLSFVMSTGAASGAKEQRK